MAEVTPQLVDQLRGLKGAITTVCLTGSVTPEFSVNISNLRSWNDRNNFWNIEYRIENAVLVEAGRDAACAHALKEGYAWLLQIDADAAPFPQDAVPRMLKTLFVDLPQLDALGTYCQVKAWPYLPTIDTGTGKWEEHYPGEGILSVIRTGAHFLMCKTQAFMRFGPPWFRTRLGYKPARAFAEVDNFARITLDGRNPLTEHPEWETLLIAAQRVSHTEPSAVGEDSGFCDALRAAGGQIAVDTDIVVGHKTDKLIMPDDFIKSVKDSAESRNLMLGVIAE